MDGASLGIPTDGICMREPRTKVRWGMASDELYKIKATPSPARSRPVPAEGSWADMMNVSREQTAECCIPKPCNRFYGL
mgnify:CR=1 FL=1